MKKLMIMVMIMAMFLVGCSEQYVAREQKEVVNYVPLIEGELYYIPHTYGETDFPNKYNIFLKENTNIEVFDIEGDLDDTTHNTVKGYFVFTKQK